MLRFVPKKMGKRNPMYYLGYRWVIIIEGPGTIRGAAVDKREADKLATRLQQAHDARLASLRA